MAGALTNYIEFFGQFRKRFSTTGAIAPSSRFLAKSMCWPMSQADGPRRILEIGPGTGAVTDRLVRKLRPNDRLDLVEINEVFVRRLRERFEHEPAWQKVAQQCEVHEMPLQDFQSDVPYDFAISGLPMNNFSPELVASLLEASFRLLDDGGVLSYFEYMYVRPVRRVISRGAEKQRIGGIDDVVADWQTRYRFQRDWVFVNLPPAWVQHLRKPLVHRAPVIASSESDSE